MVSLLKSDIEITAIEKNIGEMIINRSQKFYNNIAIKEKINNSYHKTTWGKIFENIIKISNSLIDLGFKKGDRIAVISKDCWEILTIELACISIGGIYISIFKDYYPKQIEYMIGHSDPKFLFVYDETLLEKVLSTTTIGRIEKIFIIKYNDKFKSSLFIYDFSELLNNKNKDYLFYKYVSEVKSEDPCLIIYTSGGTTGISKGALFTHKNLLFYQKALSYLLNITEKDNILSYFGWHQSFGIAEKFLALYSGACLIIDRTPGIHIQTLCNDIKECKPTIYFGSPKVFNQLVIEMENNIELKSTILHENFNFGFSSSFLPKKVIDFAIKNNINIIHGWGITETLQYITLNDFSSWKNNYSGYPIPNTEIMIDENTNEILVKGISVTKSYYKDEEKNEFYFTKDNYLRTGECGVIENNQLKLLGKLDSKIIVNNKEIYLSKLEQIVENSSIYIHHCFLFTNENSIYSIIFPHIENLQNWYKNNFSYIIPIIDMIDEEDVINLFREELYYINLNELFEYESIKKFYISEKKLTIRNGELTSSFTLVRKKVYENYIDIIEAIKGNIKNNKLRFHNIY